MSEVMAPEAIGGWGALDNILAMIGQGADYTASVFYPTPQRNTIKSEMVEPRGADGWPYRTTVPENQSMIESNWWAQLGWVNSPYEDANAIPVMVAESKGLDNSVSAIQAEPVKTTDWGKVVETGVMLYDRIKGIFSKGDTVEGTPRTGYPEGAEEQNTQIDVNRGADVVTQALDFYYQVKGLFGLGYPQSEPQPAVEVQHETKQTFYANQQTGMSNMTLAILAAGVAFLLLK